MIKRIYCILPVLLLAAPLPASAAGFSDWWLTPDQQAQRLQRDERYLEAAERFTDPMRKGVAYYRGGDFEAAAAVFGRIDTAQATYNRGNSLLLLGQYESAIASYEEALEQKPDWTLALENLAIAVARKERLAPPESDAGGTDGMLGADEIVFDDTGRVAEGGSEVEQTEAGAATDSELRATWLRRVQGDPADFLRTRFAYQLFRRQQQEADDAPAD